MATRIFRFLDGLENDAAWSQHLSLMAAQNLALATTNGNALFLESKITFRCRLFSLYAGTPGKRINHVSGRFPWRPLIPTCAAAELPTHQIFEQYVATLGVPTELAMPEEEGDADENAFPRLAGNVCLAVEGEFSFILLEREQSL